MRTRPVGVTTAARGDRHLAPGACAAAGDRRRVERRARRLELHEREPSCRPDSRPATSRGASESVVSSIASPPAAGTIRMSFDPSSSVTYTMFWPSGVHDGSIRYSVSSSRTMPRFAGGEVEHAQAALLVREELAVGRDRGLDAVRDRRVRLASRSRAGRSGSRRRARSRRTGSCRRGSTPAECRLVGLRRDRLNRPAVGADDADLEIAGGLITRTRCACRPGSTPARSGRRGRT